MKRILLSIILAIAAISLNASAFTSPVVITEKVVGLLEGSNEFKSILRANGISETMKAKEALVALSSKNPAAYSKVYAQISEVQKVLNLRGEQAARASVKTFIDADLVASTKAAQKNAASNIANATKKAAVPVSSPSPGAKFYLALGDAATARQLEGLEAKVGAVLVRDEAIGCMKEAGEAGDNLKNIIAKTVNGRVDTVEDFGNGIKANMKSELELTAEEAGLRSCALTAGAQGTKVAKEVFGIEKSCGYFGAAVSPTTCAK